jgi:anti-sigma factor RsiW
MTDLDSKLSAFVDGEIDPVEVSEIEALIARDPDAGARVREFREINALLRAACAENLYAGAPPPNAATAARTKPKGRWLFASVALAASVVIAVLAFETGRHFGTHELTGRDEFVKEVFEYHHVFARETDHLVEIPAGRSAELVAWLSDRIGRPLVVPDLSSRGYSFVGGRMLVINNQPVGQLLYMRPGELALGVCMTPRQDDRQSWRHDRDGGLSLITWADEFLTWAVIGEVPESAARELAAEVARQARI